MLWAPCRLRTCIRLFHTPLSRSRKFTTPAGCRSCWKSGSVFNSLGVFRRHCPWATTRLASLQNGQPRLRAFVSNLPLSVTPVTGRGPKQNWLHFLVMVATQRPVSCPTRPASYAKRQPLAAPLKECLAKESVETDEAEWASAEVSVPRQRKKDRLCLDYRPLNNFSRSAVCPLPRV